LKERISELYKLVVMLNFLAEFTRHKLYEHFPFKSRVPGLLNILHPLITDSPDIKQLHRRKIWKQMMYEEITGHMSECRLGIKILLILISYGHQITLTHLKLYEPFSSTVLNTVSEGQRGEIGQIGDAIKQ